MSKRLIGVFLILLLALAPAGADKKKKAYELIYEDVQLLRQQFLQLKKKIDKNNEDITFIKEQLDELLNMVKHLQTEQASFKEDQKKIPTQYQIVLEKLETMTLQLIKFSESFSCTTRGRCGRQTRTTSSGKRKRRQKRRGTNRRET
jgi:uncharacterized protein YoxC